MYLLHGGTHIGVHATYETAGIFRDLYNEEFGGDEFEPYQIDWDQLRGIAGVERLTESILSDKGEIHPGKLIVIASRPSMVQSTLLLNIAQHMIAYLYSRAFDCRFFDLFLCWKNQS